MLFVPKFAFSRPPPALALLPVSPGKPLTPAHLATGKDANSLNCGPGLKRLLEHIGRSPILFVEARINTPTPVPSRYSSAVCPHWKPLHHDGTEGRNFRPGYPGRGWSIARGSETDVSSHPPPVVGQPPTGPIDRHCFPASTIRKSCRLPASEL